jgi:lysophospholipase L1-like esterase
MIPHVDVLAREWADPYALADHDLAELIGPPAPWERVVVLGDSIAEGLREPVPGYRDLSWADRMAAGFSLARPGTVQFNLGRRNLVAREIRESQLDAALSLRPDLVVVTAGGNDTIQRTWDAEAVADELRALLSPLKATGADVLTMDLFDTTNNPYIPERYAPITAARVSELVEVTRAVSAEVGVWHAVLRDHPAASDADIFASDSLHLNARGHAIVAACLARALGAARGNAGPGGQVPSRVFAQGAKPASD